MDLTPFQLQEHPEGGRFREIYRSRQSLDLPDGRQRAALTHILYHLAPGEVSTFHRVEQEEVWNLYQGRLRLWLLDTYTENVESVVLSPETATFCHVVPTGVWQAAEPLDGDVLVGCSVAPGFDFADFTLLDATDGLADRIREQGLERLIPIAP